MHIYHCRESKISEQEKLPYRPKPIEKITKIHGRKQHLTSGIVCGIQIGNKTKEYKKCDQSLHDFHL